VLTVEMVEPIRERFWAKVDVRGPDECWPWKASLHTAGYGQIRVGGRAGRMRPAHQVAYLLTHGPIPEGKHVLHTCDNRPCTNGRHLYTGTHAQNMRDAVDRNRMPRGDANPARTHRAAMLAGIARRSTTQQVCGEKHGMARLNAEQVTEIRRRRATGESRTALGEAFGITYWAVRDIDTHAKWRHLP